MTPLPLDHAVITRRLRKIDDLTVQLERIGTLSVEELESRPVEALALERILTLIVDLAVDINGHIVASTLGRAPEDYADSFVKLAAAEVIDTPTADEMRGATGMRNVLVHGYLDVDQALVAKALRRAPGVFRAYTKQVAGWLIDSGEGAARPRC